MGVEIERKFRVREDWQPDGTGEAIAQGYLSSVPERTVRVRLRGERGYLTVKGKTAARTRRAARSSSMRSPQRMRARCSRSPSQAS